MNDAEASSHEGHHSTRQTIKVYTPSFFDRTKYRVQLQPHVWCRLRITDVPIPGQHEITRT